MEGPFVSFLTRWVKIKIFSSQINLKIHVGDSFYCLRHLLDPKSTRYITSSSLQHQTVEHQWHGNGGLIDYLAVFTEFNSVFGL